MTEHDGRPGEETLSFGQFELFRSQRALVQAGKRVRIGSRALDILIGLVERAGEVVTKKELMALAWPHTLVEETNLRIHVSALRKLLGEGVSGDRFIVNVSGQGYLFTQPVTRSQSPIDPPRENAIIARLPEGLNRLVGRGAAVKVVLSHLDQCRLATIAGPAGVGKSALALAVIESMAASDDQRIPFVELSPIEDPTLLAATLAAALDVSILTNDPMDNLLSFLRRQEMLIVLDNCEHVIDAVTPLVETILAGAPGVSFLCTSREPLLLAGEWVYRLQPLDVPTDTYAMTAAEALRYPAIQLFIERARSNSDAFEFGDAEVAAVAEICGRLDGLPLAIELVAARIDLFGLPGLVSTLSERLILVARGSRTAPARRQSIRGALDWSYALLSEIEKVILLRFSIFRGSFSLESAADLAGYGDISVQDVLDALASLTAKSLIATDTTGSVIRYRLLHVTRAYACEKRLEQPDAEDFDRRHAEHFRKLLASAEVQWETMPRSEWLEVFGHTADDVRAALDWAFSDEGDETIAAVLTAVSLPFGLQLGLIDEMRRRTEAAVSIVSRWDPPAPEAELRLVCALANLTLNGSFECDEVALFRRVDDLSKIVGVAKARIAPLSYRSISRLEVGDIAGALDTVRLLSESAHQAEDPLAILLADRVAAQVHQFAGDHPRARTLAERVLRHPAKVIPLSYAHTPIDRRVTMRIVIARSLWIEGKVDQAKALVAECLELARSEGPLPLVFAFAMAACPIALWSGDEATARRGAEELVATGRRYTLDRWERLGECYLAILDRRALVREGRKTQPLDVRAFKPATQMQQELLITCDSHGIRMEDAVRAEDGLCGWCNPEILRAAGELRLRGLIPGGDDVAEANFRAAILQARAQGALSWELRAATSLSALLRQRSDAAAARAALSGVLDRITQGRDTLDVQAALELDRSLAGQI